jgi:general secretion pathway protein K
VRFRLDDEGGRIDIGKAPPELLAAALRTVGVDEADSIARAIVAWRKPDGEVPKPATPANTSAAATNAAATNPAATKVSDSLFADVAELVQVPGMRPQWVAALAPLVTVFGNETVNPLTAPPEVLAAIPGIDPARLAAFIAARALAADPKQLAASLGAQTFLAVVQPKAVAVRLSATLSDGFAAAARAVIICLPKDRQPYRVLSWAPVAPARI